MSYKTVFFFFIMATSLTACKLDKTQPYSAGNDKPCDPDSIYFNKDIMPIIQSSCAISGCHGGGSAQEGVDLTTYASIIETGKIEAYNTGGSDLYDVITETDLGKLMPPAPADPLSAEQIALIEAWINQGAKNNNCADCDDEVFTFSEAIGPLIEANCKGCHSGGAPSGGISLTNYDEIKIYATSGALMGVINHEIGYLPMPEGVPKLDACKISQLQNWLDDGALNN